MENNTLEVVDQKSELAVKTEFQQFRDQAAEWLEKAKTLEVTSVDQVDEMKQASEARKALKKIRTSAVAKAKELKEDAVAYGRAVDAVRREIEQLIEPVEEYLEKQEKFKEVEEARIRAEKIVERSEQLRQFEVSVPAETLGSMSDEVWGHYFKSVQSDYEARKAEEKRVEEAQKEREAKQRILSNRQVILSEYHWFVEHYEEEISITAETTEEEFVEIEAKCKELKSRWVEESRAKDEENTRLKKEAEEKEAAQIEERKRADDALMEESKKAAEAQEKLREIEREKEKAAALKAEEEKLKAKEARKLANAPDKTKLQNWLNGITCGEITVTNPEAMGIANEIQSKFDGFKSWAADQIAKLE